MRAGSDGDEGKALRLDDMYHGVRRGHVNPPGAPPGVWVRYEPPHELELVSKRDLRTREAA